MCNVQCAMPERKFIYVDYYALCINQRKGVKNEIRNNEYYVYGDVFHRNGGKRRKVVYYRKRFRQKQFYCNRHMGRTVCDRGSFVNFIAGRMI